METSYFPLFAQSNILAKFDIIKPGYVCVVGLLMSFLICITPEGVVTTGKLL